VTAAQRKLLIPGLILAAAAILIVWVVFGRAGDEAEDEPAGAGDGVVAEVIEPTLPETIDAERREESDPLAIGRIDAPVGIVMFSDFQCPFCALWTDQTLPELLPYVEAGDLRIEWRDLAVFGEDSQRGAHAAYAAGLQGAYAEYSGALFAGGRAPSAQDLAGEALDELAGELGLDVAAFAADRVSPEVEAAVAENLEEGVELGVFSTPAFLVNGRPIVGAQPTEVFLEAVEGELTAAG